MVFIPSYFLHKSYSIYFTSICRIYILSMIYTGIVKFINETIYMRKRTIIRKVFSIIKSNIWDLLCKYITKKQLCICHSFVDSSEASGYYWVYTTFKYCTFWAWQDNSFPLHNPLLSKHSFKHASDLHPGCCSSVQEYYTILRCRILW